MSSPQKDWNDRNREKARCYKLKYNRSRVRIQVNLHPDLDRSAIAYLQSQQREGESISQCAKRLLLQECDRLSTQVYSEHVAEHRASQLQQDEVDCYYGIVAAEHFGFFRVARYDRDGELLDYWD